MGEWEEVKGEGEPVSGGSWQYRALLAICKESGTLTHTHNVYTLSPPYSFQGSCMRLCSYIVCILCAFSLPCFLSKCNTILALYRQAHYLRT